MVGPVSDDERSSFLLKLKLGFTVLVGVSAGLISVQADASLAVLGGAVAGGLVLGAILVWIAFPDEDDVGTDRDPRQSRRR